MSELKDEWLVGKKRIGISAGASAPEHLVQGVVAALEKRSEGKLTVETLTVIKENVKFTLPKEVRSI